MVENMTNEEENITGSNTEEVKVEEVSTEDVVEETVEEVVVEENTLNDSPIIKSQEELLLEKLQAKFQEEEIKRKRNTRIVIGCCALTLFLAPLATYATAKMTHRQINVNRVISNMTPVAKTESYDTTQIAQQASQTVVEIEVGSSDLFGSNSSGSGVIISADGYIATNYHVVQNSGNNKIHVKLKDETVHEAKVVGVDSRTDLAVLKIEAKNLVSAVLTDSDKVVVGEKAIAIGNSLGVLGGTVTQGIISAVNRESEVGTSKLSLIQTDAPVNRGNSGGGLFNESGQLIGIVTQKASGTSVEGLGFAIPSNVVAEITKEIIKEGYVKNRPTIGIQVQTVARDTHMFKAGVYVVNSSNDALKKYDRIIEVNGNAIKEAQDILSAIQKNKVNDTIKVKIERDQKEITVDVVLKTAEK